MESGNHRLWEFVTIEELLNRYRIHDKKGGGNIIIKKEKRVKWEGE